MNLGSGSTSQSSWWVSAGRADVTARIAGSVSLLGAELLAERLGQTHAGGLGLVEMEALCRTRQQKRPIEAALVRRGLAVQSMRAQAFRRFDWRRPSVKLVTLHSAHGLEFALVLVAGLQAMPLRDESLADALRRWRSGSVTTATWAMRPCLFRPNRASPSAHPTSAATTNAGRQRHRAVRPPRARAPGLLRRCAARLRGRRRRSSGAGPCAGR